MGLVPMCPGTGEVDGSHQEQLRFQKLFHGKISSKFPRI
jgi:hypothetical protein